MPVVCSNTLRKGDVTEQEETMRLYLSFAQIRVDGIRKKREETATEMLLGTLAVAAT